MTSHCITWHDTTQAITSHQMTWPSHDLTPQQTSRHQNTSLQSTKHHHHGTAEGSFTAKEWFGHRAGRSPCAHSIGKFFLCYIVLFLLETSAPGLSGYYWYPMQRYIIFSRQDNAKLLICIYLLHFAEDVSAFVQPSKAGILPKLQGQVQRNYEKLTFRVARSPCPLSSAILKTRTSTRLARCLVFSVKNPLKAAIKEMNWKLISIHQNIHQKIYS